MVFYTGNSINLIKYIINIIIKSYQYIIINFWINSLFIGAISNSLRYFVAAKIEEDNDNKKDRILVDGKCFGATLKVFIFKNY